jgi:hypothetical protein
MFLPPFTYYSSNTHFPANAGLTDNTFQPISIPALHDDKNWNKEHLQTLEPPFELQFKIPNLVTQIPCNHQMLILTEDTAFPPQFSNFSDSEPPKPTMRFEDPAKVISPSKEEEEVEPPASFDEKLHSLLFKNFPQILDEGNSSKKAKEGAKIRVVGDPLRIYLFNIFQEVTKKVISQLESEAKTRDWKAINRLKQGIAVLVSVKIYKRRYFPGLQMWEEIKTLGNFQNDSITLKNSYHQIQSQVKNKNQKWIFVADKIDEILKTKEIQMLS